MRKKNNKPQKALSLSYKTILGLLFSTVIGFIATIIISLIFSFILSKSPEITGLSSIYFIVSIIVGGLICGFISTKILSLKGIFSGLISSVPLSVFVYSLMFFISNGKLNIYSFIIVFLILLSTTIGGIISANTKRRK